MTKWIVGLLLLANLVIFGWIRWGSILTVDTNAVAGQTALNADKIKLLPLQPVSASAPAPATSGVALTLSPLAASGVPAVEVPEKSAQAANCAEWGEFSGEDLVRAKQGLATMKLGKKLTLRTVEQDHGYWVYIPPMKEHARIEQKIAELKARGVKEYFVVKEKGQWQNAISLGVFKSKTAAQKFRTTLRAKKVGPLKVGIRKSKLTFTIFVINGVNKRITGKLDSLRKDFPDSELKVAACGN